MYVQEGEHVQCQEPPVVFERLGGRGAALRVLLNEGSFQKSQTASLFNMSQGLRSQIGVFLS